MEKLVQALSFGGVLSERDIEIVANSFVLLRFCLTRSALLNNCNFNFIHFSIKNENIYKLNKSKSRYFT